MRRREFLAIGAAAGSIALAGCSFHSAHASPRGQGPSIGLATVTEGFNQPLALRTAADDELLYVADRVGRIYATERDGGDPDVFLDISDQLAPLRGNQGLLGIELHPDFEDNQRFFVRYSAPLRDGAPSGYYHTFVLSEFSAGPDLRSADSASERKLLQIDFPGTRHTAGDIAFGPNGYLYVPVGDGAGYAVNPTEDWYPWNDDGQAGQDLKENLLGSVLRIDVDDREADTPYAIPDDNPLVGQDGLDEQWAWGFRNPYRISFDGDRLFVADAGENTLEEVSLVEKGGNYGWSVKEGTTCADNVRIGAALDRNPLNALRPKYWLALWNEYSPWRLCPDRTDDGQPLLDPVVAYSEDDGEAVIGGYVYRGDDIPALSGKYVFANLSIAEPPSELFAAAPSDDGDLWTMEELQVDGGAGGIVLGFGRDDAGEMYALTTTFREGGGAVRRFASP